MVFAVLTIIAILVIAVWRWTRNSRSVATELDQFAIARSMTTRWAEHPESAPRPVLDIAARNGQPVPEQASGDQLEAAD